MAPQGVNPDLDQAYSRLARLYDLAVRWLPLWRNWITPALNYVSGSDILEISFGTGYLLSRYPDHCNVVGLEINRAMMAAARRNLSAAQLTIPLVQGNVYRLPFSARRFDTLVNTMAFSGYPDGVAALAEMMRVLKPGGRLVIIDIGPPPDENPLGRAMLRFWQALGDIVQDVPALFRSAGLVSTQQTLGGMGSIHLYLALKPDR